MNRNRWQNAILFPLLIMVCSAPVFCQLSDKAKALQGMTELFPPVIGGLDKDTENLGLTKELLQTDVELRLRKAGIHIATATAKRQPPAWLFVNLLLMVVPSSNKHAYSIQLHLNEFVLRSRQLELHFQGNTVNTTTNIKDLAIIARTWTHGVLGMASTARDVRESLGDLVDQFINDYLAANPK